MKVRLFEVFTSIEGEGTLYGTKTLFVRLAGCPFTCFYCDTVEALPVDSGTEYDIEAACALVERSLQPNTYKVNFTGGEPLMQADAVAEMARHVRSKGVPTYLESSCFDSGRLARVLPQIDLLKVEFKTRDSKFVDARHYPKLMENALECLRLAASSGKKPYIKVVVSSGTTKKDMAELAERIHEDVREEDLSGFVIQPTYGVAEPDLDHLLQLHGAASRYLKDIRVVPQLHKLIGVP